MPGLGVWNRNLAPAGGTSTSGGLPSYGLPPRLPGPRSSTTRPMPPRIDMRRSDLQVTPVCAADVDLPEFDLGEDLLRDYGTHLRALGENPGALGDGLGDDDLLYAAGGCLDDERAVDGLLVGGSSGEDALRAGRAPSAHPALARGPFDRSLFAPAGFTTTGPCTDHVLAVPRCDGPAEEAASTGMAVAHGTCACGAFCAHVQDALRLLASEVCRMRACMEIFGPQVVQRTNDSRESTTPSCFHSIVGGPQHSLLDIFLESPVTSPPTSSTPANSPASPVADASEGALPCRVVVHEGTARNDPCSPAAQGARNEPCSPAAHGARTSPARLQLRMHCTHRTPLHLWCVRMRCSHCRRHKAGSCRGRGR